MFPSIHIGEFELHLYALIFIAGVAVAVLIARRLCGRVSLPKPDVLYGTLYAFIGILIGSKLVYMITMLPKAINNWDLICQTYPGIPGRLFFLFNLLFGGLVYYGGLIGAVLFLFIYCRVYKVDFVAFADIFAVMIPFCHGIGRIGCFLTGCCYGIEYHGPFSVQFPYHAEMPELSAVPRFPVQLLEMALNMIFFGVMMFLFLKIKIYGGRLLGIYLVYYAVARYFLEMLRGDKIRGSVGAFSTSQLISLILLPLGVYLIIKGLPDRLRFKSY
ncbi:MAG: prolipoprotein diacylglyceryl transferase [Eubacterium sp.]|nr:prolipoprotein diacylglyceryl transferase [Eubacterium sp.]